MRYSIYAGAPDHDGAASEVTADGAAEALAIAREDYAKATGADVDHVIAQITYVCDGDGNPVDPADW